jgi:hypothetical protein
MKKLIFPILLTLIFTLNNPSTAQTTLTNSSGQMNSFSFEMLVEAPIYESDILGNQLDSMLQIAPAGAVFTKVDVKGTNCVIRFWVWQKPKNLLNNLNYKDSSKTEYKYFLLSVAEFNEKAIPRMSERPSFTMGATVIPIRIRNSPFDFAGEFSFGTNLGIKLPLSHYQNNSLDLVAGIHLTQITLDSLDTEGMISSSASEKSPALSFTLGGVFEFTKAQFGIYIGWDYISGSNKNIWVYQGKPWFSLGVGASLFNSSSSALTGPGAKK